MTVRSLGIVSMLVALVIGGYLFVASSKTDGPTSTVAAHAETQATGEAAGVDFEAAIPAVEAYASEHGTYAGASLPPAYGVTVARADATSYCLEATVGTAVEHLIGPGGSPAPGPCS